MHRASGGEEGRGCVDICVFLGYHPDTWHASGVEFVLGIPLLLLLLLMPLLGSTK